MDKRYVIGVDFGSDSVRALIVDAVTGDEIAEAIAGYPRWLSGKYQNAQNNMFRQHPLDYTEALTQCICSALSRAGAAIRRGIAAISVDTTGSTPCPVDHRGVPLALLPGFEEEPDAMFHLWKDHTAISEAAEITRGFEFNADGIDYTRYQGTYASEWFWAKILHTSRNNPRVREAAYAWVEHSDWIPALLVGNTAPESMYRCACAAGHKAYWHSSWGGLPSESCLAAIDPLLLRVRRTYGRGPLSSTHCLGAISEEWAARLSLSRDVLIGGSSFDAHAGAVGAGVNSKRMIVNLGTSAVNMFVVRPEKMTNRNISWACGAAENSVIPGLVGLEAGQAAFGDVYAWLRHMLMWPLENMLENSSAITDDRQKAQLVHEMAASILPSLQSCAERLAPENVPLALDWFNGRRYPGVNEAAHSAISGLGLGSDAPVIYRALIQATAMGQRRIIDAMEEVGVCPDEIIAVGGIAQKSTLLMQILSDVLGKRIHVSRTKQACARGAAMYAAVAAGIYTCIEAAQERMCESFQRTYDPDSEMTDCYNRIYRRYLDLSSFVDPSIGAERMD